MLILLKHPENYRTHARTKCKLRRMLHAGVILCSLALCVKFFVFALFNTDNTLPERKTLVLDDFSTEPYSTGKTNNVKFHIGIDCAFLVETASRDAELKVSGKDDHFPVEDVQENGDGNFLEETKVQLLNETHIFQEIQNFIDEEDLEGMQLLSRKQQR